MRVCRALTLTLTHSLLSSTSLTAELRLGQALTRSPSSIRILPPTNPTTAQTTPRTAIHITIHGPAHAADLARPPVPMASL